MSPTFPQPLSHSAVLRIAVPIMLSNVTEPMIGVVNTAVIGQLPDAYLIGGVTIGSLIFSFLFWGFGFLRLSTGGLSAQATGARDAPEVAAIVWRSLVIGLVVGLTLVALSPLLKPLSIGLMGGSPEVQQVASTYFGYRILAAPAALANFTMLGWFIGQGRASTAFVTQLALNLANMLLSLLLVSHFNMGVAGLGWSVLIAEYLGAAFSLVFVWVRMRQLGQGFDRHTVFDRVKIKQLIVLNSDMMIRTLCLLFAFSWFASRGARNGDTVIAANSVLLHMFDIAAYLIDGFAYAAEALVGQAIGAKNQQSYAKAISLSSLWALSFGTLASLVIWFGGPAFIDVMTINPEVQQMARTYLLWAAVTPLLGAACFLYDGIFTGAMATRDMRNMMIVSLVIYLASSHVLENAYGNHGLWAALCIFLIVRSISFALRLPAIKRSVFAHAP